MKGFTHESTHNESQEWYTPESIFWALGCEFDMDVASPGAEIVPWIPAKKHLTIEDNGLLAPWEGFCWLNPPYGSDTADWCERFLLHGNGIMLVFARTDTVWFHKAAPHIDAFLFIKGRVQFIRGDGFKGGGCGSASMLLGVGERACAAIENGRSLGFRMHGR